jgi:uncharacterized protein (TIGR00290 family)
MSKIFCWSGGKDSAMALAEVKDEVDGLVTTVTDGYERIAMHGVRVELLRRQAAALALPLTIARIPQKASNDLYEKAMAEALRGLGAKTVFFGDIFLEDLREYRETRMKALGIDSVFPIWGRPTAALARGFVDRGFKAHLTCVDTRALSPDFAGRLFDASLLADLPGSVDPCGENGEFHSFVFDGPVFDRPVPVALGESVLRENRWQYRDLLSA